MATIIDLGNGGFIAGDPPESLPAGHHWCGSCGGDGLGYDDDGGLAICGWCVGSCTEECDDAACDEHKRVQA